MPHSGHINSPNISKLLPLNNYEGLLVTALNKLGYFTSTKTKQHSSQNKKLASKKVKHIRLTPEKVKYIREYTEYALKEIVRKVEQKAIGRLPHVACVEILKIIFKQEKLLENLETQQINNVKLAFALLSIKNFLVLNELDIENETFKEIFRSNITPTLHIKKDNNLEASLEEHIVPISS